MSSLESALLSQLCGIVFGMLAGLEQKVGEIVQQAMQSTDTSYLIKWVLNSDGWMMLHDLKGWMKVHFLKGWLKCLLLFVEFMFHSVIGGMKLHDLTGWLKESVISMLFFWLFHLERMMLRIRGRRRARSRRKPTCV